MTDLTDLTALSVTFSAFMLCAGVPAAAQAASGADTRFVDHGVAAAVSESRGAIATADAQGNPLILAVPMDTFNGAMRTSLIVIDARTGRTEQYGYPEKGAPSAPNYCLMVSTRGMFYAMFGDVFVEFDINQRKWTFGENAGLGTAMSLAEGPDGAIYAATYPQSQLLAFDPDARKLTHLGRLDPAEQYPSRLAVHADGWVYAGIGTARANVVAFNVATKERRQLIDEADRATGMGEVHLGQDGQIYGRLPGKAWLRLHEGAAEPVEEPSPKAPLPNIYWGSLYGALPDGSTVTAFDLPGKSFEIAAPDRQRTRRTFDYESAGALITSLEPGPDGKVYGSTCHPFRLLACDTKTGDVTNLGGLGAVGGGNFCAMAVLDGLVYGAEYAGGRLYAYNPAAPWKDTGDEEANPRLLAQYAAAICRPRTAIALHDRKLVVYAGFAGYGLVGGGIGFYDAAKDEAALLENEDLLPGHSAITLRALPDGRLVGGTSVGAPGGGHPTATTARLFLMDLEPRQVVFSIEPVAGASEINCIEVAPDGKVYGITNTTQLFVFDPESQTVVHTQDLGGRGGPLRPDQSLRLGPDGRLYALMSGELLEVSTKDFAVTTLATLPQRATAGAAISGGRVYYAVGSHVWSCALSQPS